MKLYKFFLAFFCAVFINGFAFGQSESDWIEAYNSEGIRVSYQIDSCMPNSNILLIRIANNNAEAEEVAIQVQFIDKDGIKQSEPLPTKKVSGNLTLEGSCLDISGASGLVLNLDNYGYLEGGIKLDIK